MSYSEVMKKLLDVRERLTEIQNDLEGYFGSDLERICPEIAKMQKLERKVFKKVDDWSKP